MATADQEAFVLGLRTRLVGSLVLFCGDRAVAEELAQEALARALVRWDRVQRMDSPEAWTYRTAFNLARSSARRRAAERRAHARILAIPVAPLPDAATALALREAVGALPPRQRAAVIARFYGGLTVDETAAALDCAPGTVKALTHKAMLHLRAAGLAEDTDTDEDEVVRDATTR